MIIGLLQRLTARCAMAALLSVIALGTAQGQVNIETEAVRDLMDSGEYTEAIETATDLLTLDANRGDILNVLGEVHLALGDHQTARESFQRAYDLDGDGRLEAMHNLGALARYRGDMQTAAQWFKRVLAHYNAHPALTSTELTAVAAAAAALGDTQPSSYHDAVRVYGEAAQADKNNVAAYVALGNLLLDKYNNTEALETFREALEIDDGYAPALLGLARSEHFDQSADAMVTLNKSLESNPNYVPARTFLAQLLIESEQYDAAEEQALRALETNANALHTLSVLAAVYHLQGDSEKFDKTITRALAINPRYADLYNTLAEIAVNNRLYENAVDFAQRAVDMDAGSWRGYGILGLNQLRIGEMEKGHANVARAFEGDPFNVWTKNTLDFLDSKDDYETVESEHATIVLHKDEAALLTPYIRVLAEDAYRYYAKRYDWRPAGPIRIELYPDHRDFSVRTLGLAGIGILGVSFGPVVALDSPSAKPAGSFNWGAVLWHEIAHSFHMGVSRHRVPRWFSEGLAVYEEQQAQEGWGNDVTVDFLKAYNAGLMLPVSRLNDGFVRPTYPQQIVHSYYQSSLVFDFIDARWGFGVIRDMLAGYADGKTTPEAVQAVLGLSMDELDSEFDAYFRKRFATALEAFPRHSVGTVPMEQIYGMIADQFTRDYQVQMNAAAAAWNKQDMVRAETYLLRALELFPEYAGADSAYWYLAEIYRQRKDLEKASQQLTRMVAINADHYQAHVLLGGMLETLGKKQRAAEILARSIYIYPYNPPLHEELAALYEDMHNWPLAVRARESVLALAPVDMAEAHYRLANAHARAGDKRAARYQVLRALELAPSYPQALELLLELRAATTISQWIQD
ncbi:MAG: tetratricopeptide repeat protein [Gammaproteobacteria bacterium]|jgi:tetratricopeptide (TPR) repeat protein|nr:tetratricopeptide repeat protein [Gammaproteobacteria bacterium]